MRKLTALLRKEEDMYVAFCPELGTTSQGETTTVAIRNLKEACELYLAEISAPNLLQVSFEVAGHANV